MNLKRGTMAPRLRPCTRVDGPEGQGHKYNLVVSIVGMTDGSVRLWEGCFLEYGTVKSDGSERSMDPGDMALN